MKCVTPRQAATILLCLWEIVVGLVLTPASARAHEAYVIESSNFWHELGQPIDPHAIDALKNADNVSVTVKIIAGVLVLLALNFWFRRTRAGELTHGAVTRLAPLGPFVVRAAIAVAFFVSAQSNSLLGPELPLTALPAAPLMRLLLYAASILIAIGLVTEIAAVLALIVFTTGLFVYGDYLFTYLNYLGEIIVLLLFGMRRWSLDSRLFGRLKIWRSRWERYETSIIRIFYGLALLYAGITVKLFHPDLTVAAIEKWNLTQFHWLFPADPLLVALGAGLVEAVIGLLIIIGFEMRLTVLISLFYITLSLLYFRELVWPHLLLYGISLNLLVQPEVFTLDHVLFHHHRRHKHWLLRPFSPHRRVGKSHPEHLKAKHSAQK